MRLPNTIDQERNPIMSPTAAERGQETRARLLDAAGQLIVEDGWGAVTTRKVAERAGLRAGLVHYHFPSVTDLLIDAALASARREVEKALAVLAESADAAAGVDHVLDALAAYSGSDPATVLFSEMLLAASRTERLRAELSVLLGEWRTAVTDWLRTEGGVEDPEATAVLLGAVLDGLVLHRLIDPELAAVRVAGPLKRLVGGGGSGSGSRPGS
jgi:AcrR family transcriptional regulator